MSDDDKIRPRQERIARLFGATCFKDVREGFGGAAPTILDEHLCVALALCRTRRSGAECDVADIGPEVLETYFGSTQEHRRRLVRAYIDAHAHKDDPHAKVTLRRLAATLAAQKVAGVELSRAQQAEYAYIAWTRRETLLDAIAHAYSWYMVQMDIASPRFKDILNAILKGRLDQHLRDREQWETEMLAEREVRQKRLREKREARQRETEAS